MESKHERETLGETDTGGVPLFSSQTVIGDKVSTYYTLQRVL